MRFDKTVPPSWKPQSGTLGIPPLDLSTPGLGSIKIEPTVHDALNRAQSIAPDIGTGWSLPAHIPSYFGDGQQGGGGADAGGLPQATPDAGQAPSMPPPVDASRLDGQGRLKELVDQAFRAMPGEPLGTTSWKIQKRSDFLSKLPALGPITADQAEAIFNTWYQEQAPQPYAFSTFPQEEQQLLQQAYGGTLPTIKPVGRQDLDPSEMGLAGGMLLAGMLHGNVRAALPIVSKVFANAQARRDQANSANMQADQMARQDALAKYERLKALNDFNNTQQGYLTRDMRMSDRQDATNKAVADRQQLTDDRRFKRDMASKYFGFLAAGDPARASAVKSFYESETGSKVDEHFNDLAETGAQRATDAGIVHTNADTDRIHALVTGMGIQNEIHQRTMEDVIKDWHNKAGISAEQLRKLKIEVEKLPAWYDERTRSMSVNAAAAKMRAEAELERARKASSGDATTKERISNLSKVATTFNSAIDNKRDKLHIAAKDIEDLKTQIRRDELLNDGKNAKDLNNRLQAAQSHYNDIANDIDQNIKTVDSANAELDKIVIGGGH